MTQTGAESIHLSAVNRNQAFLNTIKTLKITIFITLDHYLSIIAKHTLVILKKYIKIRILNYSKKDMKITIKVGFT